MQIIEQRDVLGKDFKVYGDWENPLFLAKDVASWIEHNKPSELVALVDESEKYKILIDPSDTIAGVLQANTEYWFLTEDGVYEVLMQSRKPIAKEFKKQVKQILRDIRKTGGHVGNEDLFINTYLPFADEGTKLLFKTTLQTVTTLNRKIEDQKPLVAFAETCLKSKDNILVRQLAKVAYDEGINIGEKRLYNKLREWELIAPAPSTEPYQRGMNQGYFKVSEDSVDTPYGIKLDRTTLVTPKGQVYIINRLKNEMLVA